MTEKEANFTKDLLERYNAGKCSEAECRLVDSWFNYQAANNPEMPGSDDIELIGREIWHNLPASGYVAKRHLWYKITAAAAMLAVVCGIFLHVNSRRNNQPAVAKQKQTILPGTYGATLTLGNGNRIALRALQNGVFAEESTVTISKTAKGELVYKVKDTGVATPQVNTLSTAKGETFKVELPDGSSVWLDAASTLTYSTNLATADIRKVSLTGEAYFKVAHDAEHPFVVKTAGHEVKVLGTEFNISSYPDDDVETTTLIKGSVSMSTANQKVLLVPGQQGVVNNGRIEKSAANIYAAIGWKNNEFVFASQDIRAIMKLIARWYDVDIYYEGNITNEKISGNISRFADINSVVNILRATEMVKVQIDGRKLIISGIK
ncbi:FecR domain-containing protein [Mucilaginibacter sp. RS28]|uniref:FecR domain-containing protein n=1 Tax=Mucilaginibacter straminoryzae TaxID=2932774 RepID=A0A9X1X0Y0_9SPHI|nr:FecR domain-containing protein [Mucilaginibacter straminoryzae]MCJ8209212.1 FecR domain-containing protein [Mucilaginibacter straminoryzae]